MADALHTFIAQLLSRHLRAGERPLGCGLVLHQPRGMAVDGLLAVATDERLMLFESGYARDQGLAAVAVAGAMIEWDYRDIADVIVEKDAALGGTMLTLVPRLGCGPHPQCGRYRIPARISNLDHHAAFAERFAGWLRRRVTESAKAA